MTATVYVIVAMEFDFNMLHCLKFRQNVLRIRLSDVTDGLCDVKSQVRALSTT